MVSPPRPDARRMLDCGCQSIRNAFKAEKLILAQDGTWVTSGGVFLAGDEEDVPGAAVIRASVLDLSLWRRIGVAERPSADWRCNGSAHWPRGRRCRLTTPAVFGRCWSRYPSRIWEECGHWVNLLGEWVPVDTLAYALSMQTLFAGATSTIGSSARPPIFSGCSAETVQAPPLLSVAGTVGPRRRAFQSAVIARRLWKSGAPG